MNTKNEIMQAFEEFLKSSGKFKKVKRGTVELDGLKTKDVPICAYNSVNTSKAGIEESGRDIGKYETEIQLRIVDIKKRNYYERLDELTEELIELFKNFNRLHRNIYALDLDEVREVVNDNDIDGLIVLDVIIVIGWFKIFV